MRIAEKIKVRYIHEVTSAMVAEFVDETRRKYAGRTARGAEQLLKSAFARFLSIGMRNPFAEGIVRKIEDDDGDMVHRQPFTAGELSGLSAGIPMEVVRLVTGHKTVEVVLKHYFKPGREHLRAVLGDKLPDVLTGGKEEPKRLAAGGTTVQELAAKVADNTATEEERKRLGELLTGGSVVKGYGLAGA